MVEKIQWQEPKQDSVTQVEISRSITIYGTYSVINTIDATSDGAAKTAANTWVTTYTDGSGTKNDWYKVRFYDSDTGYWSNYSEPITNNEQVKLCSVADVKEALDTAGRWTDDEIFKAIDEVDEMIYAEMGTPINAISSEADYDTTTASTFKTFFVGQQDIYRIDKLFVGTGTMTELFMDDEYKVNNKYGMVRILPYASSGFTFRRDQTVEIHFVPKIYNRLCIYRTVKFLLEKIDTISGGTSSKELETINNKLVQIEQVLGDHLGIILSSDYKNYDGVYGQNLKKLTQKFKENKYMGNYGW